MALPILPSLLLRPQLESFLREDLGRVGDLTSDATLPADAGCSAELRAREAGVAAGLVLIAQIFELLDSRVEIELELGDGDHFAAGDLLAQITGPARAVLTGERVMLNLVARMCGIATGTARYVEAIAEHDTRLACTRKTTPGLRLFEKYAVRCGGGSNHRFGLDDAVMIKDNHIAVAGSLKAALERCKAHCGHMVRIEVEVDRLEQLDELLELGGADVVLLDNFSLVDLREAVRRTDGQMVTEASGGITLETIAAVAATGVDVISSGALTHQATSLDLGLDITITS